MPRHGDLHHLARRRPAPALRVEAADLQRRAARDRQLPQQQRPAGGGTAIPGGPGRGREGGPTSLGPRRPAPRARPPRRGVRAIAEPTACVPARPGALGSARGSHRRKGGAEPLPPPPPPLLERPRSRAGAASRGRGYKPRGGAPGEDTPKGRASARPTRPRPGFKGAAPHSGCAARQDQARRGLAGGVRVVTLSARSQSVLLSEGLLPNLSGTGQSAGGFPYCPPVPRHLHFPQAGHF